MKIVILDGYALNPGDLSWASIEALGEVTLYERSTVEQIAERCADAEIVLTNKVPFSRATMEGLKKLRYIGVQATGYNIIDVKAARELGIVVTNIPAYSTASVAQSTFALLLAISNRVEHYTAMNTTDMRWSRNVDFCYWDTPLMELSGKVLGIFGMGRIGTQVAAIAKAFGMRVITYTTKQQSLLPPGVEKVHEMEFWHLSDVITLHCPLTSATTHLVNKATIAMMKPGAIVLNTARGNVVDEYAVASALESGRLAAYGADVLSTEPPAENNPLLHAPNVFLTPHIAWATREARQRLMDILTQNIACFLKGKPINTVI